MPPDGQQGHRYGDPARRPNLECPFRRAGPRLIGAPPQCSPVTTALSILNRMEKTTGSAPVPEQRIIRFEETESGMVAGLWHVPVEGFAWRHDLRPWAEDGEILQFDAPPRDPGPWLVAQGDVVRRYPPMRRKGVLEALDRVAQLETLDAVQKFANGYGAFGAAQNLVPMDTGVDPPVVTSGTIESGESLGQWRTELMQWRDLRLLWQAIATIGASDSWGPQRLRDAKEHIESRIRWSEAGGCRYHSRVDVDAAWREWNEWIYHPSDQDSAGLGRRLSGNNTHEAARYYLHRRVNGQLRGTMNAAVMPYLGGAIRFFPESLLAAAYLRFAQELAGRLGPQRECEYCGLAFRPTRRDKRFCTKNCQEASAYHRRVARSAVEPTLPPIT
jgi:predicted nucleic acid-binding Zn ribbon protein